ncbi:MAG: hypothetical protein JNM78_13445 [Cyclobacteriaceae bacterium]|nr:hypothetical protein [Cyclobacteriaceae bacterium]
MIWQVIGDHKKEAVQRDFLRFTAQQILKNLRNTNSPLLDGREVGFFKSL